MAHFAKISDPFFDNDLGIVSLVESVHVISNSDIVEDGEPNEQKGIDLCKELFNGGEYRQCSYNARIRNVFPGPGYFWSEPNQVFIPPKPTEPKYSDACMSGSGDCAAIPGFWYLDENTLSWQYEET